MLLAGGRPLLEEMEAANLFLVPLDEERGWFRYHHLFGDMIRARSLSTIGCLPTLHKRAADWFRQAAGMIEEAIHHALTGTIFLKRQRLWSR